MFIVVVVAVAVDVVVVAVERALALVAVLALVVDDVAKRLFNSDANFLNRFSVVV